MAERRVTLDIDPASHPDLLWDANVTPYPFLDGAFEAIHAFEVLEHLGTQGDWRSWFHLWDEFYRLLEPGGFVTASVPRADSIWAWGDPGHTRIVAEPMLYYLHRPFYDQVGTTSATDYRAFFVSDWDIVRLERTRERMLFALQPVRPAR